MLKKTNFAGYEKDESSNLIINKNKDEYTVYLQNKERVKEFRRMSNEIEKLKADVDQLKNTVQTLVNLHQNGNL